MKTVKPQIHQATADAVPAEFRANSPHQCTRCNSPSHLPRPILDTQPIQNKCHMSSASVSITIHSLVYVGYIMLYDDIWIYIYIYDVICRLHLNHGMAQSLARCSSKDVEACSAERKQWQSSLTASSIIIVPYFLIGIVMIWRGCMRVYYKPF